MYGWNLSVIQDSYKTHTFVCQTSRGDHTTVVSLSFFRLYPFWLSAPVCQPVQPTGLKGEAISGCQVTSMGTESDAAGKPIPLWSKPACQAHYCEMGHLIKVTCFL